MTDGKVHLKIGDDVEGVVEDSAKQCGLGKDGTLYYIEEDIEEGKMILRYGVAWGDEGEYDPIKYLQELDGSSACCSVAKD